MGNDTYLYCKAHGELLESDIQLEGPEEGGMGDDGEILDQASFVRAAREFQMDLQANDPDDLPWIERAAAIAATFLLRHGGCSVYWAQTYGPEEYLDAMHEAEEEKSVDSAGNPVPWCRFFMGDDLPLWEATWRGRRAPPTGAFDLVEWLKQQPLSLMHG